MSDIFISYAKEDRDWVISLADVLRQQGWTVWWDRSIPFGQSFQEVIESELSEAKCAIVVWSRHSVDSGWVSAEADEARNRNILVPVLIDDASPPLVFRQLQTANLKGWTGDTTAPVLKKLITDLTVLLGEPATHSSFPTAPNHQESKPAQTNFHKWPWFAGLAGLFAVAAFLLSNLQEPKSTPVPIIHEFSIEDPRISSGDISTLIWKTSNASSVEIREMGEVAHSGSSRIRPEKTGVYTLIARNEQGQTTQKTVEVIVEEQQEKENSPDPQMLVSLFNDALNQGRLDLAEQFLEKATDLAPDHPDVLIIKDRFGTEKQQEKENQRIEQQKSEQQQSDEKKRIAEEKRQENLKRDGMEKTRIAEIQKKEEAEDIKRKELQHKEQARISAEQEKNIIAIEEKRLAEIERQKKLDAEQLQKEQQRQEKIIAEKRKTEEEKLRQQELTKQKALVTPAPIVVRVDGVEKRFNRDGLLASSLRDSAVQQLQAAGFKVISMQEAKNNKDSIVMMHAFKYIENTTAGYYSFSASTKILPTSTDSSNALWTQGESGIVRSVEFRKVNDAFTRNVEKFIRDHPRKGLEFRE